MFNKNTENISKPGSYTVSGFRVNSSEKGATKPYAVLALSEPKGKEIPLLAGVNPKTKGPYNNITRFAKAHGLQDALVNKAEKAKSIDAAVAATVALAKAIGKQLTDSTHTMKLVQAVDQNGKKVEIKDEPVMRVIEIKSK